MTIIDTCRAAWNGTKQAHQPVYDDLIESYRNMLTARAEAVMATKLADDGPFAAFENAVLNAPPEPAVSSDQGYEQVVDAEPIVNDADQSVATIADELAKTVEQVETKKKSPKKKAAKKKAAPKKAAVKKNPKVVKKTKK
jgi:hypothetical protein